MLRKEYEIAGTELPIFARKEDNHFTFEEIVAMGRNLNEVQEVGFIEVNKGEQKFFEKIFVLKG